MLKFTAVGWAYANVCNEALLSADRVQLREEISDNRRTVLFAMIFSTVLVLFGLSQIYWAWRGYSFLAPRLHSRGRRAAVCGAVLVAYILIYQFTLVGWRDRGQSVYLTRRDALLFAP